MSWPSETVAERYRNEGLAGMGELSSCPHHCPRTTPTLIRRKIVHLRWKQRLGPIGIAAQVGRAPSAVHHLLICCRINRLSHVDRATGQPVRRYEHPYPGDLVHADVKKLGNPRRRWVALRRSCPGQTQPGRNSRVAYTEIAGQSLNVRPSSSRSLTGSVDPFTTSLSSQLSSPATRSI